jgi:hypothetical protein
LFNVEEHVSNCIFGIIGTKKLLMGALVFVLALLTAMSLIADKHVLPAYAEQTISANCGPRQQSDLAISITTTGFSPNTILHYKFIRPDKSVTFGGVSTGPYRENTVAINIGNILGSYKIDVYKEVNNSYVAPSPIYSSTIVLPCKTNHFTTEYYRMHPDIFQYLLGIKSIYNDIKIGSYLVGSPLNALNIMNLSHSDRLLDQLAAQVLAAEFHSANGATDSCIDNAIHSANVLLKEKNYNGISNSPRIISPDDLEMLSLKNKIESYNKVGCT